MSFASLYSHGFVRVAAAVPHMRIGEPEFNAERTLALARQASEEHAAVVIFPELGSRDIRSTICCTRELYLMRSSTLWGGLPPRARRCRP